jgi:hypothetical protein
MARSNARRAAIQHRDLAFEAGAGAETAFTRADLIFDGVPHAGNSYEVRVFLNNKRADEKTARSQETGYAGRFMVFGHGGCFGADGHCDTDLAAAVADRPDALTGRRHGLAPRRRILTITDQLRRLLSNPGQGLKTLTLVPVSRTPRRSDQRLVAGQLTDDLRVTLQTYR